MSDPIDRQALLEAVDHVLNTADNRVPDDVFQSIEDLKEQILAAPSVGETLTKELCDEILEGFENDDTLDQWDEDDSVDILLILCKFRDALLARQVTLSEPTLEREARCPDDHEVIHDEWEYRFCPFCGASLSEFDDNPSEPAAPEVTPTTLDRCIIRPDDNGAVDDVVIDNVTLFRMERMDKNLWWLACHFGENHDRICFMARHTKKDGLVMTVTETPETRRIVDDSGKSSVLEGATLQPRRERMSDQQRIAETPERRIERLTAALTSVRAESTHLRAVIEEARARLERDIQDTTAELVILEGHPNATDGQIGRCAAKRSEAKDLLAILSPSLNPHIPALILRKRGRMAELIDKQAARLAVIQKMTMDNVRDHGGLLDAAEIISKQPALPTGLLTKELCEELKRKLKRPPWDDEDLMRWYEGVGDALDAVLKAQSSYYTKNMEDSHRNDP